MPIPSLVCLLLPGAHAFAPVELPGVEPEATPILRLHPARQGAMARRPAWRAFLSGEGAGWLARFDEDTGLPRRAWGRGIDIGAFRAQTELEQRLLAFVDRHPELFGVPAADLAPARVVHDARRDAWYVDLEQRVHGVPVHGSRVVLRVLQGRLVMFGAEVWPQLAGTETTPAIDADRALEAAIAGGPAPSARHAVEASELVVLPEPGRGGRLAWRIRTRTPDGTPPGWWLSFVDARTGEPIRTVSLVRFASGTITADHDLRTADGQTDTSPVPEVVVAAGADERTFTDATGFYDLDVPDGTELSTRFRGSYVQVENRNGEDAEASFEGGDFRWSWNPDDDHLAQVDTYLFALRARDWGRTYAPDSGMVTTPLDALVNITAGSCNAYYDGRINFYNDSSQCNNTGRILDVVVHEWGHGFHYYQAGSIFLDGAVGEGVGDSLAVLQTGDPLIAPYFYKQGWGIREVETNRVYPDDVVGQVHEDGLIFVGSVWDLWKVLQGELDEQEAYDVTSQLLADALRGNPSLETAYDEFVFADDDDGDLSNGTPHQCAILDAFGQHGLGPGGSAGAVVIDHAPLENQLPWTEVPVRAALASLAPDCTDAKAAGEGLLHYSTDAGASWETLPLAPDADTGLEAVLPALPGGTIVHYYLEVPLGDGETAFAPTGGSINPHSFVVGELTPLYFEDFEDDDGGYTHELIEGERVEGADDWQWGTPRGLSTDPDGAFSGSNLWGNDLGGPGYDGEYQNNKHNRLTSVPIDISAAGSHLVVLQFRRWLAVEDGYYDQARVLVDGATAWTNHASEKFGAEHHIDDGWALHTLPVYDRDGDGLVTVSWEIDSDGGLTYGGWNLDDVAVYEVAPDTGPPPEDEPGAGDTGAGPGGATGGEGSVGLAPAGCGCSGSGAPAGFLGALLAALVATIRRRDGCSVS